MLDEGDLQVVLAQLSDDSGQHRDLLDGRFARLVRFAILLTDQFHTIEPTETPIIDEIETERRTSAATFICWIRCAMRSSLSLMMSTSLRLRFLFSSLLRANISSKSDTNSPFPLNGSVPGFLFVSNDNKLFVSRGNENGEI